MLISSLFEFRRRRLSNLDSWSVLLEVFEYRRSGLDGTEHLGLICLLDLGLKTLVNAFSAGRPSLLLILLVFVSQYSFGLIAMLLILDDPCHQLYYLRLDILLIFQLFLFFLLVFHQQCLIFEFLFLQLLFCSFSPICFRFLPICFRFSSLFCVFNFLLQFFIRNDQGDLLLVDSV